jgi:hypothetical protein
MNNLEQIGLWICFWPTSLVFRFWTDVVGRGWNRLLMASRGFFESAAAKHDVKVTYGTTPPASPATTAEGPDTVIPLERNRGRGDGTQG